MHTWKRPSPKRNRRRPQRMERLGRTLADRGADYRLVEDVQVPPNTSRGLALGGALLAGGAAVALAATGLPALFAGVAAVASGAVVGGLNLWRRGRFRQEALLADGARSVSAEAILRQAVGGAKEPEPPLHVGAGLLVVGGAVLTATVVGLLFLLSGTLMASDLGGLLTGPKEPSDVMLVPLLAAAGGGLGLLLSMLGLRQRQTWRLLNVALSDRSETGVPLNPISVAPLLKHTDLTVRVAAARYLATHGDASSVPALAAVIHDEQADWTLRGAAQDAIERLKVPLPAGSLALTEWEGGELSGASDTDAGALSLDTCSERLPA